MTYSKTVTLPVSPDDAFALVTQPERLRRWMTVSAYVELRAGGSYRWTVVPGAHAAGTVREVVPGRRVVLGWGWDEGVTPPADGSLLTVTIEPAGDGSQVTLVHEGLTAEEEANHAEGWDHFLERLESAAATGDAGQDPWGRTPQNLTPMVAAEAALAAIQPVLRAITDADAERTTPCPELPVGALVDPPCDRAVLDQRAFRPVPSGDQTEVDAARVHGGDRRPERGVLPGDLESRPAP